MKDGGEGSMRSIPKPGWDRIGCKPNTRP